MIYTDDEIVTIKNYYAAGGVKMVQRFINRTGDSIRHKAKSLGIKRLDGFRESKVDFDYLIHPQTAEAAYILGIIWGDGHLSVKPKFNSFRYSICLRLIESDFKEIKHLFRGFGFSSPKKYKRSWKKTLHASITHKKLGMFLEGNDYREKSLKSPTKILKQIPEHLQHYFFRGWFDADGSNNQCSKRKYGISVAGSYDQDWSEFVNLCQKLEIKYHIYKRTWKKYKSSLFSVFGYKDVIVFRDYLFQGEKNIGFSRKRQNFLNIPYPLRPKAVFKELIKVVNI